MYRPELKVVDCTIRDGGLMTASHFDLETVRAVFGAVCKAGVDYCELGYRNSKEQFSTDEFGPWRFCDEDQLVLATDGIDRGSTKIAVMMDAHKSNLDDLLPSSESVVDMVRVATYVKDIDKAIRLAKNASQKGYEITLNIMAISHESSPELDEALCQAEEETDALAVYIVDSFGSLYCEQAHFLVEKYKQHLKTKAVGAHFHNNQQLAFANTIESIVRGADFVDGTLFGMGRAAGNCPLELLVGFLKNPKFTLEPLLGVIAKHILPLTKKYQWGYHIPYMISGVLDKHPLDAMKFLNSDQSDDFVGFLQDITREEVQS